MMDHMGPNPHGLIPSLVLFPLLMVIPLDTGTGMVTA